MTTAAMGVQKALARAGSSVVAIAEMQADDLLAQMSDDQKASLAAALAPAPEPKGKAKAESEPDDTAKPAKPDDKEGEAIAAAASARVKIVAKAVETDDACKGKAALALAMLADDDFAQLSGSALVKLIGKTAVDGAQAGGDDAALAAMQAALAETGNSDVDANGGGNGGGADKGKAANDMWDRVYADLSPKSAN